MSLLTSTAVISLAPPKRETSTSLPPPAPMISTFSFSFSGNILRGKYPEKLFNLSLSRWVRSPPNRCMPAPAPPSTKKIISSGSSSSATKSVLPKALQRDSITLALPSGLANKWPISLSAPLVKGMGPTRS